MCDTCRRRFYVQAKESWERKFNAHTNRVQRLNA